MKLEPPSSRSLFVYFETMSDADVESHLIKPSCSFDENFLQSLANGFIQLMVRYVQLRCMNGLDSFDPLSLNQNLATYRICWLRLAWAVLNKCNPPSAG